VAAALAIGGALSCQLLVDVGGLSNGECGAGYKACDNMCVSESELAYGCSNDGCAPCAFAHAFARCDSKTNACISVGCVPPYTSCPDDNGCATDTAHDANNCGGCGMTCPPRPHSTPGCAGGLCAVASCDAPYEDCDRRYPNGCETNLQSDPAHCGACDHACDGGVCVLGVCQAGDAGTD
jgi:hypothetical protein